ncbi:MAG: protein kinase [Deltaproteobacteria bacterium]|nr:protein kinase [Deltaproteobacteria bacterium]
MAVPPSDLRFCPVCGKAFPAAANFCPQHGRSLVAAPPNIPDAPPPQVPPKAAPAPAAAPVVHPAPSAPLGPAVSAAPAAPAPSPAPRAAVDVLAMTRPSAVPPMVTDAVRAAVAGAPPPPAIFTDAQQAQRPRVRPPPPLAEYLGQTIYSQFVVEELRGVGSTGTVFRATQLGIGRPVALKVLHPDLKGQPEIVERFRREAQIASRLSHPNIVHLYLTGLLPDGNLFLAMEYVVGLPLTQVMVPGGMQLERALHIIEQVLSALGEAHRAGIVHRDLKPENVMLTRLGEDPDFVKVLDFGIARILDHKTVATRSGLVFGSPRYISPEAAAGDPADERSDIYSCGVLLYEMLAGRPPFDSEKPLDLLMKHIQEAAPPLSGARTAEAIPAGVEAAVHQALEKKADRRFRTADVVAQALRGAAESGARKLAQSAPRWPEKLEPPASPSKAVLKPPAMTPPVGHAFVMAAPVIPAAALPAPAAPVPPAPPPAPPAPPLAPAGWTAPPVAESPAAPTDPLASTAARDPGSAPSSPVFTPGAPFAVTAPVRRTASPVDSMRFDSAVDQAAAPPSRKGLWLAIILGVIAAGLLITLILVLAGGSDDGKRPRPGAVPAAVPDAGAAPDVPPLAILAPPLAVEASSVDAGPAAPPAAPDAAPAPVQAVDAAATPETSDPTEVAEPEGLADAGESAEAVVEEADGATEPDAVGAEDSGSEAGTAPADAGPDRATGARDGGRRRDSAASTHRDAGTDGNAALRPFDGRTPVIVTNPKDIGR